MAPTNKRSRNDPPASARKAQRNSGVTENGSDTQSHHVVANILEFLASPVKSTSSENARTAIHTLLKNFFHTAKEREHFISSILRDLREKNGGSRGDVVVKRSVTPIDNGNVIVTPASSKAILYNARAFHNPLRDDNSARKQKDRLVNKLQQHIQKIGTPEEQLCVLHDYLSKKKGATAFVEAIKIKDGGAYSELKAEGIDVLANLREMFEKANKSNTNNQVVALNTAQRTVMLAISPNEMPNDKDKAVKAIGATLGMTRYRANKYLMRGIRDRKTAFGGDMSAFLPVYTKRHCTRYSKDLVARLHHWLFHICQGIVVSPHSKDTKLVTDIISGLKSQQQKYFYTNGVAQILKEAGKLVNVGGFDGPRDKDGKLLISDTMLRAMLPKNLSRMTDSHMDLCACEDCFVPKKMMASLYSRITRAINNEDKSLTSEEIQLLRQVFFVDWNTRDRRYKTPQDVLLAMTCAPVHNGELFSMKCALGRCEKCPDMHSQLPSMLKREDDDAMRISFVTFKYHSFCKIHKSIPGAPSVCPHCSEDLTIKEKRKLFHRKKQVTQNNETIGKFFREFFFPEFRNYRRHIQHVILLGINYCIKMRNDTFLTMPGCISWLRDFADALTCTMNNQFQSTHFGENAKINFEGLAVKFMKLGEMIYQWHACLRDGSQQDSRTCYTNTDKIISHLNTIDQEHLLKEDPSWLMEQSDGKAAQYRCGTSLKLQAVTSCKHNIVINKMVTAPHHGKGDCDSQGGVDKAYMRKKFRDTSTLEQDEDRKMSAALVDADGRKISLSKIACRILSDPERVNGFKGYGEKHRKREASSKIQKRTYHHMDDGTTEEIQNTVLPIKNTRYKFSGFKTVKGERHNGLSAMYHSYSCPHLGPDKVAVRRIPCSCKNCVEKLKTDWELGVAATDQPRFQRTENCELGAVLDGYNDWTVLDLSPVKPTEEMVEEIQELNEDILVELETNVFFDIKKGDFAAYEYDATDDYYLIQWTSEPFNYTSDHGEVEGTHVLEGGCSVCCGKYWENVGRTKQWYMPTQPEEVKLFRVRYVPFTGIAMEGTDKHKFPNAAVNKRDLQKVLSYKPKRMVNGFHDKIMVEMTRRAAIDYEENPDLGCEGHNTDSDDLSDEEEQSQEDSNSDGED